MKSRGEKPNIDAFLAYNKWPKHASIAFMGRNLERERRVKERSAAGGSGKERECAFLDFLVDGWILEHAVRLVIEAERNGMPNKKLLSIKSVLIDISLAGRKNPFRMGIGRVSGFFARSKAASFIKRWKIRWGATPTPPPPEDEDDDMAENSSEGSQGEPQDQQNEARKEGNGENEE